MLSKAYNIMRNDDSVIQKTLVGLLFIVGSILIVPIFFYQGYLMKILKQSQDKNLSKLPEWKNFTELFKYGLIGTAISVMFGLPNMIIQLVPEFSSLGQSEELILIIGGLLVSFIFSYISFGVLAITVRDGIEHIPNKLSKVVTSKEYIKTWFLTTVVINSVFAVASVVFVVLTLFLGLIVVIPLAVAVNYFTILAMGLSITDATDSNVQEESTMDGSENETMKNSFDT